MPEDREARRAEDVAAHKAAVDAQAVEAPEFHDAGYDETLPGQEEVIAGTVEHEKVLATFPNATSYGPDVNVVVPEPEPPPDPPPENGGTLAAQSQWQRE
jgi:hypothetical protein